MKKIVLIFLVLTMLTGVLVGCDNYEDELAEKLRNQIEWYDDTTKIKVVHVYKERYVLTATHTFDDGVVGIDVYITLYDNDKGEYVISSIYSGGQIN